MSTSENFNKRIDDIAHRAHAMRQMFVDSQFNPETGQYIGDETERALSIDAAAAENALFESCLPEHRMEISTSNASAIAEYEREFGCLPSDEILASAHKSMENMLQVTVDNAKQQTGGEAKPMYESIGKSLSTSDGVEIRAKMVALVLPTLLATATSDAVTYIPAANDEVEIFNIIRTAGTTFGEFKKGQLIDDSTIGQYSQMRQRYKFKADQQPDGSKKEYVFTPQTDLPNTDFEIPVKKGTISLYVNRKRIARDYENKAGRIHGDITIGGVDYTVSATVDYNTGKITVTTATALPEGVELHYEFEVDIETKPELIPLIDHEMESRKIRPSQSAIAADATIQAMFRMDREYGLDLKSMQMSHLRNYLADEKAKKHLRDMIFATVARSSFNIWVPVGEDWKLHRELIREKLLLISQQILRATRKSGMRGLFAGIQASTVFKSLGAPFFIPAANYQQVNRIHFTGTLFGMFRVYEVPTAIDELGEWDCLCYGRGASHSEAGYVAADAIPATMYDHPIGLNLRSRETLWELAYGEIHPFNGEAYFHMFTLENTEVKPNP
ncbi:TPA: hypothetical protein ACX6RX_003212 [Photobacterium damselae]